MSTMGEHHAARIIIGVFTDREQAHDAARELHDAGFKRTWIGTTRPHGPKDSSRGVESGTLTADAGVASDEQLGVSEVSQRRAANQSDDAMSVREEFFTERGPIPRSSSRL